MKSLLSTLGITAALVMAGVSAAMNYVFLASLGKTPFEGEMLGAASAAADVLKALLPFFIAWAWASGRYVGAVAGSMTFVLFAGFSLLSAIGFAADNRGALIEDRAALDSKYAGMRTDIDRLRGAVAGLPAHRPQGVSAEELRAAEQDRLWSRSKACTEATETASREFCTAYYRLRAEQAAAMEAQRLGQLIQEQQGELDRLKAQGAGQGRDPQASVLAKLSTMPEDNVRLALIVVVALVVEFGSSLGLYLATGHAAVVSRRVERAQEDLPGVIAPPLIRLRPQGAVEDFCLQALLPSRKGSLRGEQLYIGYQAWCESCRFDPLVREEFLEVFRQLAAEVNISQVGDAYSGIALKANA